VSEFEIVTRNKIIDDLSGLPRTSGGKQLAFDMGTDDSFRAVLLRLRLPADEEPLEAFPYGDKIGEHLVKVNDLLLNKPSNMGAGLMALPPDPHDFLDLGEREA